MKRHIALQFHQVRRPPGTEIRVRTAPVKKFPDDFGKYTPVFKINGAQGNDLARLEMECAIDLRTDHFTEAVLNRQCLVKLDGADLNDFKGKLPDSIGFSGGTLVPFQIENNEIHAADVSFLPDRANNGKWLPSDGQSL